MGFKQGSRFEVQIWFKVRDSSRAWSSGFKQGLGSKWVLGFKVRDSNKAWIQTGV